MREILPPVSTVLPRALSKKRGPRSQSNSMAHIVAVCFAHPTIIRASYDMRHDIFIRLFFYIDYSAAFVLASMVGSWSKIGPSPGQPFLYFFSLLFLHCTLFDSPFAHTTRATEMAFLGCLGKAHGSAGGARWWHRLAGTLASKALIIPKYLSIAVQQEMATRGRS
ncbi:hypothetical protein B0T22DRAFT_47285 [Podospora appendiculata]|uniref:Uncharacterized protein n=1 Tax=Podospora appendiculata TaxID=314037 RepID=A0AAE0XI70_9PEZI|nr:hypothetical protein B0T22DRAFT_47285 [Podospora appendiculata]